jgi:hypothetical protein
MAGLFLSSCNTATYKRLQRLLYHLCSYTAHAAKQSTGLYRRFSCGYASSTAHNTRPTQAAIIPPAPRWSVSQRPDGLHRYQIPAPRRTLYRSAQPPYYNKVYKGAPMLQIYARRCSIPQTMPARRGQLLPPVDRWQVLTRCQQYRPGAPTDGSTRLWSRCFSRHVKALAPG